MAQVVWSWFEFPSILELQSLEMMWGFSRAFPNHTSGKIVNSFFSILKLWTRESRDVRKISSSTLCFPSKFPLRTHRQRQIISDQIDFSSAPTFNPHSVFVVKHLLIHKVHVNDKFSFVSKFILLVVANLIPLKFKSILTSSTLENGKSFLREKKSKKSKLI